MTKKLLIEQTVPVPGGNDDEKERLLISLVDRIHDCLHIQNERSLMFEADLDN
jgi:hypothetical protein